jgi:2-polyprenyl-6-methoxyphenol hydroxylase-like FAD-dependent oxidoreductase
METINTRCVISGGGPAGIMLGFLLARQGIDVVVLEKWPDFFRDFRGDTIHPSTMEVLHELGLLEEFLKLPHSESAQLEGDVGECSFIPADFTHLKLRCPFIAFIPQWDFLNFITKHASKYPNFHLLMETEATDLIKEDDAIVGIRAKNKDGEFSITADVTIAADGRHSILREKSGLSLETSGAPIDILWFRISRLASDPLRSLGRVDSGRMMILIERTDYWQCGYVIRKDGFEPLKAKGIDALHTEIAALTPWLDERVKEIDTWDKVKLLSITIDHLEKWYLPGFLCLGDAAHAMSPIGGVGINLAIQDAVAAANILGRAFAENKKGKPTLRDLYNVQKRRKFPARMIQHVQVLIQNKVVGRVLSSDKHITKLPWQLQLFNTFPVLRRIPAYFIGVGIRPEHIEFKEK